MGKQAKIVELAFEGEGGAEMAQRFFSYLVDGGLEDQLIQMLGGKGLELEISGCDSESLRMQFRCRNVAATTAVKAPVKAAARTASNNTTKASVRAAVRPAKKASPRR